MDTLIKEKIEELEKQQGIKILLACETGSRAWGFPSPDSDFDVRLLYVHPIDWYLKLTESKDAIDVMYEHNEIDISGWELKKALHLLWKSNAAMTERIQSPIIYKADTIFLEGINALATQRYSRITTMHHYLSMAKKNFETLTDKKEYKLKQFFYALRAAFACKWILEKRTIVPITFETMLSELIIPKDRYQRITELIKLKSVSSEAYMHQGEIELLALIETFINIAEAEKDALPSGEQNMPAFNEFFITTLKRVWT
jgi:predicted nucleotidyltransferase